MKNVETSPLVLVVDDDTTTTRVLEGLLGRAGIESLCAHDLAGAEAALRSEPVSLMLLDVNLPDGNGLDLCERLSAERGPEQVPILFISANDDLPTKVRGFAAGAVDYITKPLAGAEVLARVGTHLRLRAAYEELAALQAERIRLLAASQQALMPSAVSMPEARFSVCLRQVLQAGGDFYDVLPAGRSMTDYVVADAAGHDLAISLWTASFKTLLADYATATLEPHDICRMINRSLRRVLPEGTYFTAIYARLDRARGRLTVVNAGHPAAILLDAASGRARAIEQSGDVVGMFPDAVFGVHESVVKPGDRLFLYTDGLIEVQGTRDDGIARLVEAAQATAASPLDSAVPALVQAATGEQSVTDDIVMLGVEV